jgi:hypothetical protein
MGKVVLDVSVSLDGFTGGPNCRSGVQQRTRVENGPLHSTSG